jgi:5'-nucleotidase
MESQLRAVSNLIPEDPATKRVVDDWVRRAFAALKKASGHDPNEVVATTKEDLEGREAHVRRRRTNLTDLVARALLAAVPKADLVVYNSGMIRIDDLIPAGRLTYYDVLRILPFGGDVAEAQVKGSVLQRLFDEGFSKRCYDSGAFLQAGDTVTRGDRPGVWLVKGKPLDPDAVYRVATNDYLASGKESKLSFLKGQVEWKKRGDLRNALAEQLRREP